MSTTSNNTSNAAKSLFARITSRHILITACALIAAGYLLMSGPGSTGQSFCPDIFSTRRIVIAPMLCLSGYLLVVIGILRRD